MKIEAIYHSKNDRQKEKKGDPAVKKYAKDSVYHPFMIEREYVRALSATKLDRMFAKPFVGALTHHGEGISMLIKDHEQPFFATASYDNQVTLWDMLKKCKIRNEKFEEPISAVALDGNQNIYVSQSKTVLGNGVCFDARANVSGLDYSYYSSNELGVATSLDIQIFDVDRQIRKITYRNNTVSKVKFNHSFRHVLGAVTTSGIELFDNRVHKGFASLEAFGSNCMEFSPQEGFIFSTGNEDGNAYMYDLRNLDKPLGIFRGHVNAVVALSYHPNGKEIATGSYDKTIRIFDMKARKSRECYYNSRMQLVHGVTYSNDGKYIISGSDDGCLRLWKSQASKKLEPISRHEREAIRYREALKEKYKDVGDVARISKHRFLPKEIKQASKQRHEMYEAQQRREERRRKEEECSEED